METVKVNIAEKDLELLREIAEYHGITFRQTYEKALDKHLERYSQDKRRREYGPNIEEQKAWNKRIKTAYKRLKKRRKREKQEKPDEYIAKVTEFRLDMKES